MPHDSSPLDTLLSNLHPEIRSVFESLNEGLILADKEGIIHFANGRFQDMTGFSQEEIVGKKIYEVFYPNDSFEQEQEASRMKQRYAAREKGLAETYESHIYRRDGERRWIETKAAPLFGKEGRIIGSIGANSDITERKLLQEQLNWSQKLEAVGRLAGGVAHDFNNLLTVILGYTELLRQQLQSNDVGLRKLNVIQEASESAITLTQQLLTISRKQIVNMRAVSINDIVESSLRVLQGLIGERIHLTVDLTADLPAIRGDAGQIQQILLNLVVNARDAMTEGGNLLIETSLVDHNGNILTEHSARNVEQSIVRLRVEDNGLGMDEAVKARIFEPFFTTKQKGMGSGLGLSISFNIAEEHAAEIRVASAPNQGTLVDVLFPATALRIEQNKQNYRWKSITGSETILVAEDNIAVRVLIKETLEKNGYRVIQADDGKEAEEIFARMGADAIDMLITDLVMPRVNGLDLAKQLIKQKPGLRVLLISGYAEDPAHLRESRNLGYSYLAKPFSPETLLHQVRFVLDEPQERLIVNS